MCGEKQSIKQIYFKGSGKECRMHVQQLNLAKGMKNQVESADAHYDGDERQQTKINDYLENELPQYPELKQDIALDMFEEKSKPLASSRWEQFVEIQEGIDFLFLMQKLSIFIGYYGHQWFLWQ